MTLDIILPPKCLNCSARVDSAQNICPDCWKKLHFLSGPKCSCCGYPFEIELANDFRDLGENLCAACQKKERAFDRAVSALRYDDDSRKMVIGFKHHDKPEFAGYFTKLMLQAGKELFENADLIMPVPLHKHRQFSRRYNQSALLSRNLAKALSLKHDPKILVRIKNTPPQQGNLKRRAKNVIGAFKVVPERKNDIKNKNILLIDDVYTTGATTENCAKALKKAGAQKVFVLTVYRVVSPYDPN
ncbi:MAG: ComF family protein [Alphaproteobacteria bacterium]|nr:ComF family protein [Alphaproteobacteria bacterium]HPF46120.1 ComF family protein [Emcibacteraceae bacterium]HRW30568.1 ComF family protein [Emcibacteraceae bacterium]